MTFQKSEKRQRLLAFSLSSIFTSKTYNLSLYQCEAIVLIIQTEKPLRMGSLLMERIFWSTPNRVLTAHTEWLSGVRLRHSVLPVPYTENCEGWWLSGCHGSVTEHWLHKPGVLGSIPGDCRPFHFPLFRLKKYIISLSSNMY